MKTQIEDFSIKNLFQCTSITGWVLLARPVIYLLFSRRRDLNAYSAVDFSAMVFILYAVVAFIVGIKSLSKSESGIGNLILSKSPITIFLVYSVLGIVSMFWSVLPTLTGFRAFECIAMTILIVAVIKDLFETSDLRYVILWSLIYCTWDTLWSILRIAQWTLNINVILQSSQMMSTSFFFLALYFIPRRWYNYLIIIMSIFSMSTVAYIGMGVGLISAFWQRGKSKMIAVLGGFIILLAAIAVGPYALVKNTIFFEKKEISIEETSGRDHLLNATINCVDHYPFGLGFFAAEPYVLYASNLGAISAHNSLFSAGMGMGIPGIITISIFFIAMGMVTFSKYIPPDYRAICIGCFCVAFMHCMGNPSVGTRVFGAWMPCMYIFVLISGMYVYGKYYETEEIEYNENNLGNSKFS